MAAGDPGKVIVTGGAAAVDADYVVKQNDTANTLNAQLTYLDGSAVNLTGATVNFLMRSQTLAAVTTNTAATIVTPTTGNVSYAFAAADTKTAGLYQAAFRVTFSGGAVQTFPADGYLSVWVEADLLSDTNQYLVSLPDLKDHLTIPATDRTRDQKLLRWLMAARPVIENITGPIIPTAYDEWYDGTGTMHISLRHRPLITLEAVSAYIGPVEYALTAVTQPQAGSVFSQMTDRGSRIVRRGPGGSEIPFPVGKQNIHVLYTAGFAVVPENVRIGTLLMIEEHWVDTQQPGWGDKGRQHEPATRIPPEFLVSDRVRELLEPNRRHPSVA